MVRRDDDQPWSAEADGRHEVDAFLLAQPPPLRSLLEALRELLHATVPGLGESIKRGIPFFGDGTDRFYLNPRTEDVVLGFCQGAQVDDPDGLFDDVKKEVATMRFRSPAEKDPGQLQELIQRAARLRVN